MKNATGASLGACCLTAALKTAAFPQDGQGVVGCTSRVDHQRQIHLASGPYVGQVAFPLPCHVRHRAFTQAVIVEAGLTDTHHSGAPGPGEQVIQRGLLHALVVRVHAYRAPQVAVVPGQPVHVFELFQRGANA